MKSRIFTNRAGLLAVLTLIGAGAVLPARAQNAVFAKGGVTGLGARPLGMAGAFVAIADESSASYWNPAGLVQLNRGEAQYMFAALLNGKVLNHFFTFAQPFGDHMVASGSTEIRQHTGGNKAFEMMNVATFATPLNLDKTFSFGLNFKYISVSSPSLSAFRANGWGADAGFLYRVPVRIKKLGKEIRFGLKVEDLSTSITWDTGEKDKFPTLIRSGLGFVFNENLQMAMDMESFQDKNLGAAKGDKLHMGLEGYFFQRHLGLRMGYSGFSTITGRYAAGLSYESVSWDIHYAFLGHSENLGTSHRVSGTFRIGKTIFKDPYSFIPQGVRVDVQGGQAYLIWEKDPKIQVSSWNVYISEMSGQPGSEYSKGLKDNYLPLVGLPVKQKLYFTVKSFIEGSNILSEASREVEFTPGTLVKAPELMNTDEKAVLTVPAWDLNALSQVPGFAGVNVYISDFKDDKGLKVNSSPVKASGYKVVSKEYSGLKVGQKYWVRLVTVQDAGGKLIEGASTDPFSRIAIPESNVSP